MAGLDGTGGGESTAFIVGHWVSSTGLVLFSVYNLFEEKNERLQFDEAEASLNRQNYDYVALFFLSIILFFSFSFSL